MELWGDSTGLFPWLHRSDKRKQSAFKKGKVSMHLHWGIRYVNVNVYGDKRRCAILGKCQAIKCVILMDNANIVNKAVFSDQRAFLGVL